MPGCKHRLALRSLALGVRSLLSGCTEQHAARWGPSPTRPTCSGGLGIPGVQLPAACLAKPPLLLQHVGNLQPHLPLTLLLAAAWLPAAAAGACTAVSLAARKLPRELCRVLLPVLQRAEGQGEAAAAHAGAAPAGRRCIPHLKHKGRLAGCTAGDVKSGGWGILPGSAI